MDSLDIRHYFTSCKFAGAGLGRFTKLAPEWAGIWLELLIEGGRMQVGSKEEKRKGGHKFATRLDQRQLVAFGHLSRFE